MHVCVNVSSIVPISSVQAHMTGAGQPVNFNANQ